MSLAEAGLKDGATLVLENGVAPKPGQITLSFASTSKVEEAEITLGKVCLRGVVCGCLRGVVCGCLRGAVFGCLRGVV